jgi:FAD/FMN-containing dehydrogenase
VRSLPERATALFALEDTRAAVELLSVLSETAPSLEAAELFYQDGLELVCDYRGLALPFSQKHPVYVLVECAATYDPTDELAAAGESRGVRDVAVAVDASRREALWSYREYHTEAINASGIPHKLDIGVAVDKLADFEARCRQRVAEVAPQAHTVLFGHLGDGNIHVNIIGADPDDQSVDAAVLELVADCGGTVSAEHGIGVAKRSWLSLTRSAEEIHAMAQIKRSLDPQGRLNPGVIFQG